MPPQEDKRKTKKRENDTKETEVILKLLLRNSKYETMR